MRDFCKISPKIWQELWFRSLANDDQRLLYLYFLTSAHQNSSGCCRLTAGYACDDLNWRLDQYLEAVKALVYCDRVLADEETDEILIVGWFKYNAPQNEKHKIGTVRLIEKIQSERLRNCTREAFDRAWKQVVEAALQRARAPQR